MTEEISMAELLPEIKKGWKWIALVSALCLILSVVYSVFFIPRFSFGGRKSQISGRRGQKRRAK